MNKFKTNLLFLLLILFCFSCGNKDDQKKTKDIVSACQEFLVSQSFGLSWKNLNHRISRWDIDPLKPECLAENLNVQFIGGDWTTGKFSTDFPIYQYRFQKVKKQNKVLAQRIQLSHEITLKKDWSTQLKIFNINEIGFNAIKAKSYVALIEGIKINTDIPQSKDYPIDTYKPSLGYTSRGMGIKLELKKDKENLELKLNSRFEAGTSDERPKMNSAIPHAKIKFEIDVLLLASETEAIETKKAYILKYSKPEGLRKEQKIEPADKQTQETIVKGPKDLSNVGIFGFSEFNMVLYPKGEGLGYYIRDLSVDISLDSYDKASGEAKFLVSGYASNSSKMIAYHAMVNDFSSKFYWIPGVESKNSKLLKAEFKTEATKILLGN